VLIPKGKIAMGKLAQALVHGANVIQIEGNFDEALCFVRELGERSPLTIVNSINPDRIEGQKTAALEIIGSLGGVPDIHCLPVGNAGNITAYWMGYKAYASRHGLDKMPRMLGFQAEGAAPIVLGKKVDNPETIATAIRTGNPASWQGALQAAKESNGAIRAVSDEEILEAYRALASNEGIFCEPASAASLAGLKKAIAEGLIPEGSEVVCTLTGHGLKDPDIVVKSFEGRFVTLKTFKEVESVLLGARA
jgi:threonine synthase